jgi:protein TonB
MTALPNLPDRVATLRNRHRGVAAQMLGAGLFVSLYVHIAGPALYGLATSADVGLFAPTRNRASVELTLSLPSRASQASAEAALVRLESKRDVIREAEKLVDGDDLPKLDEIAATPTRINRLENSPSNASAFGPAEIEGDLLATEPSSAERPVLRPLDRRRAETAPLSAELVAESYSPARAATVDSPSQIASQVRLGAEAEALPELIQNPPPIYPPDALRQGIEGRTIVRARIGRTGSVLSTAIAESSGAKLLDDAAEAAVRRWTFRPATRFGLTVEMEVGVPVTFSIEETLAAERDPAPSVERTRGASGPSR